MFCVLYYHEREKQAKQEEELGASITEMPPAHFSGPAGRRDPLSFECQGAGSWPSAWKSPAGVPVKPTDREEPSRAAPSVSTASQPPGHSWNMTLRQPGKREETATLRTSVSETSTGTSPCFRDCADPDIRCPGYAGRQIQASIISLLMEPGWEK